MLCRQKAPDSIAAPLQFSGLGQKKNYVPSRVRQHGAKGNYSLDPAEVSFLCSSHTHLVLMYINPTSPSSCLPPDYGDSNPEPPNNFAKQFCSLSSQHLPGSFDFPLLHCKIAEHSFGFSSLSLQSCSSSSPQPKLHHAHLPPDVNPKRKGEPGLFRFAPNQVVALEARWNAGRESRLRLSKHFPH